MLKVIRGVSRLLMSPEQRAVRAARQLGIATGLPCGETQAFDNIARSAAGVLAKQGLADYRRLYEQSFADKQAVSASVPVHAAVAAAIDRLAPADEDGLELCEQAGEALDTFWRTDRRSSFAAAVYAQALFNTGLAWRGPRVASEVPEHAWDKLFEYTERAHDVLFRCRPADDACPLWHRVVFSIGISDGTKRHDLDERFDRACRFDPYDATLYETRTVQLLPRWHGSFQEIEVFAANAVTATSSRLGEHMYARIYAKLSDFEDLRRTIVDYGRLAAAYVDWIKTTSSQMAANKLASAAYAFGDEGMLTAVCRGHLRELRLEHWSSPEEAAEALSHVAGCRQLAS